MSLTHRHRSAGVSLIEALVALAVMAFGILGVTGIQATLRANSDISRQRSEAVRIAQQAVEQWRSFTTIPTTPGQLAYDDIANQTLTITDPLYNTTCDQGLNCYTLTKTVTVSPTGRAKTLVVLVTWTDRTGVQQSVGLSTVVAGISPELAGALTVAGDASPEQQARGRNAGIPMGALDNGNGTSNFAPPGTSGVTWVFNNLSGLITSICNPTCNPANAFFLGGFVSFSTGGSPSASNPAGEAIAFSVAPTVTLTVTMPSGVTPQCSSTFVTATPRYVEYDCAIPLPAPPAVQSWTGSTLLTLSPPNSGTLSANLADTNPIDVKVCRYTTAASDTPPGGNQAHPKVYSNVTGPLPFQNFLITSAGDGSTAYACPSDGTPTIITYRHQPAS